MNNSEIITGKINVMKIDKAKMFNADSGAVYLDIVLIPSPENQYGNDYMIVQGIPKEARDAGMKGAILGNAKIMKPKTTDAAPAPAAPKANDLPF